MGQPFQDPKLNPADMFSDEALTIPLQNPIRTDAYGRPVQQIYISGAVSYRLEDANGVLVEETGHCLGIGSGSGGTNPEPLQDRNHIRPVNGNIIKNGVGLLTFESVRITATGTFLNTGSSPKIYVGTTEVTEANGYQPGSDGFTAILAAENINEKLTLELKSTANGVVLDSASAIDVLDGLGSPNTFGVVEASNGLAFTRALNQGAWSPAIETELVATFFQDAAQIAQAKVLCELTQADGSIVCSVTTSDADIAVNFTNNGTSNPYVLFTHSSGEKAGEQLYSVQSGSDGPAGAPPTQYQLVAPLGVQLLNGLNPLGGTSLTLEIFRYDSNITQITSGTIQIYDESGTALGYNPVLDSADINDSELYVVKDGPTGPNLDQITLLDVSDGVASNATSMSISPTAGLQFVRDTDGAWLPAANVTDLICSVFQAGATIAQETVRVTRNDTTGNLTATVLTDDSDVSFVSTNDDSRAITVEFTHIPSGTKSSERVISVLDGTAGSNSTNGGTSPLSIIKHNDNTFTPTSPESVVLNWTRDGSVIATRTVEIAYDATGFLSANTTANTGEATEFVSTAGIGTDTLVETWKHTVSGAEGKIHGVIVADGSDGVAGEPVQPTGGGQLDWVRIEGSNGTVLQPSGTVQDRTLAFIRSGSEVASRTIRATLTTGSSSIAITDVSNSGEATTLSISGNNSSIATATVTHVNTGATAVYQFTYLNYDFGGGK